MSSSSFLELDISLIPNQLIGNWVSALLLVWVPILCCPFIMKEVSQVVTMDNQTPSQI